MLLSGVTTYLGDPGSVVQPSSIGQAMVTVLGLGLVGGLYPAWRAARLAPIEALRYEGGTMGRKSASTADWRDASAELAAEGRAHPVEFACSWFDGGIHYGSSGDHRWRIRNHE